MGWHYDVITSGESLSSTVRPRAETSLGNPIYYPTTLQVTPSGAVELIRTPTWAPEGNY